MSDLRRVTLRYLPIVVVCAVVAGLVAYLIARSQLTYTARATVALSAANPAEQLLTDSTSGGPDSQTLVNTQVPLVTSSAILRQAQQVVESRGLQLAAVQVTPNTDGQTLTVAARADDRRSAALTANAVVDAYRNSRRRERVDAAQEAADSVQDQIAALTRDVTRLRRRQLAASSDSARAAAAGLRQEAETRLGDASAQVQQLRSRAAIATSGVALLEPADPGRVVPSGTRRTGLLGAVLGALVAAIACFLRERFAGYVRRPEDVEEEAGVPVLSDVPRVGRRARRQLAVLQPASALVESLRRIRVNLRLLDAHEPVRTVLVTSADRGEGKSFIAANLAAVWAASGQRALLLSTDLRKPQVERLVGATATGEAGLASLLVGPQAEVIRTEDVERVIVGTQVPGLDLLPAGRLGPTSVDLLQDRRFADLLGRLRSAYDVVVLDSPPVLSVSDALVLSRLSDATVLVGAVDRTRRSRLRLAREGLEAASSSRLHAVVNRANPGRSARRYVASGSEAGAMATTPAAPTAPV